MVMDSPATSDLEMLKLFLVGLRDFMGRGSGAILSEAIHMQESAFSRFINEPKRHFDIKTMYALTLMGQLKGEILEDAELISEGHLGPITFREWKKPTGELAYTWFPKKQENK